MLVPDRLRLVVLLVGLFAACAALVVGGAHPDSVHGAWILRQVRPPSVLRRIVGSLWTKSRARSLIAVQKPRLATT